METAIMVDVLIVLQSHSKQDAWNIYSEDKKKRYVNAPKLEVSKRCFRSLLKTIQHCQTKQPEVTYRLIVLDDDSDQEFIDLVRMESSRSKFSIKLEHTTVRGIMPSIGRMYEIGLNEGKNLVYFAQDDYLYYETALWEMIDGYARFRELSGYNICVFPYNDPFRRTPRHQHNLIPGANRYWFTDYAAACCIMVSHDTLKEHWELFELFGQLPYDGYCEDKSINRLFINFVELPERPITHLLFVPVTSLALHLGYESERDPYINWRELWDQFETESDKLFSLPEGKIVANIGSGTTALRDQLFSEDLLENFTEITIDLDKTINPTICADSRNLSMLPNDSIDCVYSSHSLEHVSFMDIKTCLEEWYRIIKPGGEIRIIVPNLKHIHSFIESGMILDTVYESPAGPIAAIDMLYGYRRFVAAGNEYMQHKTGFTKESAEIILASLSLTNSQILELDSNLMMRIFKPRAIPQWS